VSAADPPPADPPRPGPAGTAGTAEAGSGDRPTLAGFVPAPGSRLAPDEVLDRFLDWVGATGLSPWPAQEEALLELAAGRHVVLATPTGSGKSLVAAALHHKALCEGRRSFYTAPVKALVSEKFFALCAEFGAENVGMLTGDASINAGAPIVCCTAEVLSNMALRQGERLDAPYVVMDEFHYYSDRDRGMAWQVPLLVLPDTCFLLMSATLGRTPGIEADLRARTGREVAHIRSQERPVPLDFDYREELLHETVQALVAEGRAPVYAVSFTQRECAELAQALTSHLTLDREQRRRIAEALGGFRFDSPYGRDVQRFVRAGIGVHHAGLLPRYRLLVERLAQQGLLQVICGTDTLGVGVNVPIRTVLFTRLCKFDGEKTAILPVRDFKQISGRAGRKGFDERGSVVAIAPEHVVLNRRLDAKVEAGAVQKKKRVRAKPPPRGFVPWSRETFEQLIARDPEPLQSRFRVSHGLVLNVLQRDDGDAAAGAGYRALIDLIGRSHEDERARHRMRREAALIFRSLRRAGIVELVDGAGGGPRRVRVHTGLQRDFSLHDTLSLWLVDAVAALDRAAPGYALDVVSLAEAVLENPRPVLLRQVDRAKRERLAELKAEGVPYEDRIRELEDITWPKPLEEFVYASFDVFAETHPWLEAGSIRPKSVAREMAESFLGFHDYVRSLGLERVEGVLLRYLGRVYTTLSQTVPEHARSEELEEVLAWLRALVEEVDASLVEEWESLVSPGPREPAPAGGPPPRIGPELARDPRVLRARVRQECVRLALALGQQDFEEATACVLQDPDAPWDARRFQHAMAPFFEEHGRLETGPAARRAELTRIRASDARSFEVMHTLVDPEGENLWCLYGRVLLADGPAPEGPILRLERIGT